MYCTQYTYLYLVLTYHIYLTSGTISTHLNDESTLEMSDRPGMVLPAMGFCNTSYLTKIFLTYTPLKDISSKAFVCMDQLRYLNLTGCGITYIPAGLFKPLHNLVELKMRGKSCWVM